MTTTNVFDTVSTEGLSSNTFEKGIEFDNLLKVDTDNSPRLIMTSSDSSPSLRVSTNAFTAAAVPVRGAVTPVRECNDRSLTAASPTFVNSPISAAKATD